MKILKYVKYIIEAFFVYLLFFLFKVIGISFARTIGSFLLKKIGFIFRKKKLISKNISNVFKKHSDQAINDIIEKMWSNYGLVLAEYIFLKDFRLNKFKKPHMRVKGEEILKKISDRKKPVIFISGHFSNFEMMAMELEKRNINLATIYRPLNNIFLNPIMIYLRKKYICRNQIKKGLVGTRETINYLKKNTSIALMVDQRVGESERFPFFGIPAHTTTIPAQLSLKFDLEIIPIYLRREKDNSFYMEVQEPLGYTKTNNLDEDKKNITLSINKKIEEMILRSPGQWIWTHSRWK